MKKLLTAAALLALLSAFMATPAHAQTYQLFPTGSSISANGTYGNLGQDTSVATDWIDCQAFSCEARIVAVGAVGLADFTFQCKIQLADTDETPYPCVSTFTVPTAGVWNLTDGAYHTLSDAAFYRLRVSNYAAGNWKIWIRRKSVR
jgi:hypothetical protein